jgi:hypothetical protein
MQWREDASAQQGGRVPFSSPPREVHKVLSGKMLA